MRVITKALRYWKTEHHDLENCQDAYDLDASRGLFVVADGAGTTLFPALWAHILAQHFVHIPLMSKDPFEIEWWVRQAQDEYKKRIPNNLHDWSIRQKALNQSSDSTLATLRITDSLPGEAHGELLVVGDSCVIIGDTQNKSVTSFVLQHATEFAQPPICLPSTLRFFNRSFHTCSIKNVTLRPEHIVIIASDAVAKWILSAGNSRYTGTEGAWDAFQAVYENSAESWPGFIDSCREAHEMVNDDSTVVILTLFEEASAKGEFLGTTTDHDDVTIQARKATFEQVRQEQNSELLAIYFGDGVDLQSRVHIGEEEIKHARAVADALKEVLRHFRQAQNQPNLAARMQPIWRQYGPLLEHEKCAENIRETLRSNGVNLSLTAITSSQVHQPLTLKAPESPVPEDPAPQEQRAEQEKQEMVLAERNFLKAYADYVSLDEEVKKEHYDFLLNTADTLKKIYVSYKQVYSFTAPQDKEITLAQSYKQATDGILKALRDGYAETIIAAYQPELISGNLLSQEQLRRVDLAKRFLDALQDENDRAILTTYDEMSLATNSSTFQITEQERLRVAKARERMQYLERFRDAINSGRLPDIAARYDPLLDTSKEITDPERALFQLAGEFVAGYKEDDAALVASVEKIERSGYSDKLAFTGEERNRIEQAKRNIEEMQRFLSLTVAKVKGLPITVEQVRYVCLIRQLFYESWISRLELDLQSSVSEAEMHEKKYLIDSYQSYIAGGNIVGNALRELINDVLIREKMKDRFVQEQFLQTYKGNEEILKQFEYLRQQTFLDYHTFCKKHHLDDEEVQEAIKIFMRFDFYKTYYEQQQKEGSPNFIISPLKRPSNLEDWLEKQYKDVTYTWRSIEQTAQWLTEKLDWKA